MKYDAILFDLDGTLLPMDNDTFTKGYLKMLSKHVAPLGYEAEKLVGAMWEGVASMVKNNRERLNFDVFWSTFEKYFDWDVRSQISFFDKFYSNQFNDAIKFCTPSPLSEEVVNIAHKKAEKVILATNPFFPLVAVESRLKWAGIDPSSFDRITHYENSSSCKPNPQYYLEIAEKMGIGPSRSIMVGNNAEEDIKSSKAVGFSTYLITDCLISAGELPETEKGSLEQFKTYLENL